MNILLLIPNLNTGGAENLVCSLYNEYKKRSDINVYILVMYPINQNWGLISNIKNPDNLYSLNKNKGFDIRMYWKIFCFIKKYNIDIIHAHTSTVPYILLSALFFRHRKFFVTVHTDANRESSGITKLHRFLLYKMKLCTPIAISQETAQSFREVYHSPISVIENGVPIPSFTNDEIPINTMGGKVFVHIGRFHKIKNQLMLVQVFDSLIKEGYDVNLIMIGRNSDDDVYLSLKGYFSDRIRWIGEQKNPVRFLINADAFCLSSLMEGSPMSILESFSIGCPVITTPVGGCKKLVNEMNGVLSKDCTKEEYIKAVKYFLSLSQQEISSLRNNAKKDFIEKYNISITADRYIDLYNH